MTSKYDRIQAMVDNEALRASVLDTLAEMGDVREWADALTNLADAIDTAASEVETWQEAEREDKADARDTALAALEEVASMAAECSVLDMDAITELSA